VRREDRLRQRGDFRRAFAGRAVANRVAVLFRAANTVGRPRVGFAVPRSVGGAVRRNRVRRQFRAAYSGLRARVAGACDLVFLVRPAAVGVGFAVIGSALKDLLQRSGMLGGAAGPGGAAGRGAGAPARRGDGA
jgi:ribonuclease P protein component